MKKIIHSPYIYLGIIFIFFGDIINSYKSSSHVFRHVCNTAGRGYSLGIDSDVLRANNFCTFDGNNIYSS